MMLQRGRALGVRAHRAQAHAHLDLLDAQLHEDARARAVEGFLRQAHAEDDVHGVAHHLHLRHGLSLVF